MSIEFCRVLCLSTSRLDARFSLELANGETIESNEVARGCKLTLYGHEFSVDLLPITLGSFDVAIGIDWLSKTSCHFRM